MQKIAKIAKVAIIAKLAKVAIIANLIKSSKKQVSWNLLFFDANPKKFRKCEVSGAKVSKSVKK